MLRNKAIEKIGLFDESFGKYFEDVDICLRIARGGWRMIYHARPSAYHSHRPKTHQPQLVFDQRLEAPPSSIYIEQVGISGTGRGAATRLPAAGCVRSGGGSQISDLAIFACSFFRLTAPLDGSRLCGGGTYRARLSAAGRNVRQQLHAAADVGHEATPATQAESSLNQSWFRSPDQGNRCSQSPKRLGKWP